jgi:hypothetical protein
MQSLRTLSKGYSLCIVVTLLLCTPEKYAIEAVAEPVLIEDIDLEEDSRFPNDPAAPGYLPFAPSSPDLQEDLESMLEKVTLEGWPAGGPESPEPSQEDIEAALSLIERTEPCNHISALTAS